MLLCTFFNFLNDVKKIQVHFTDLHYLLTSAPHVKILVIPYFCNFFLVFIAFFSIFFFLKGLYYCFLKAHKNFYKESLDFERCKLLVTLNVENDYLLQLRKQKMYLYICQCVFYVIKYLGKYYTMSLVLIQYIKLLITVRC